MPLVSVSRQMLYTEEPLPFDIFDSSGRLLLKAFQKPSSRTLEHYFLQGIYTTEDQFKVWNRSFIKRLHHVLINPDVKLSEIANIKTHVSPADLSH